MKLIKERTSYYANKDYPNLLRGAIYLVEQRGCYRLTQQQTEEIVYGEEYAPYPENFISRRIEKKWLGLFWITVKFAKGKENGNTVIREMCFGETPNYDKHWEKEGLLNLDKWQ